MATYVLVHGSWHGGWCWRLVAPLLRAAGHQTFAPTLTGLAERAHGPYGRISLATHVKEVADLLFYEDMSNVVLAGHSYAAMVITGVAATRPERLSLLVYLDAYIPSPGQSEFDLWPTEEQMTTRRNIAAGNAFRPPVAPSVLGVNHPAVARWVSARMTPHPLTTYEDAVPGDSAGSAALPRIYIHCTTTTGRSPSALPSLRRRRGRAAGQ